MYLAQSNLHVEEYFALILSSSQFPSKMLHLQVSSHDFQGLLQYP